MIDPLPRETVRTLAVLLILNRPGNLGGWFA